MNLSEAEVNAIIVVMGYIVVVGIILLMMAHTHLKLEKEDRRHEKVDFRLR